MKRKLFTITLLILISILVGCGESSQKSKEIEKVYYKEAGNVLDFGYLSGVVPQITYEEEDSSTTYLYEIDTKLHDSIFKDFSDSLKESGYKSISPTRLTEDGGVYEVMEDSKNQLMFGDYSKDGITYKLLVSIRPKYKMYKNYPQVPDFGGISKTNPSEELLDKGIQVYIYEELVEANFSQYTVALLAHDFERKEGPILYGDGYLFRYSNDSFNVVIGLYPDYLSISIGSE